jgi:hypothetical protein
MIHMTQPEQETDTPAPIKRVRKTAADKAQAALDMAKSKLFNMDLRIVKARAEVATLLAAREKLVAECSYLARNPVLVTSAPFEAPPEGYVDPADVRTAVFGGIELNPVNQDASGH